MPGGGSGPPRALSATTAAGAGVILNPASAMVVVAAAVAPWRFQIGMMPLLAGSALAGRVVSWLLPRPH